MIHHEWPHQRIPIARGLYVFRTLRGGWAVGSDNRGQHCAWRDVFSLESEAMSFAWKMVAVIDRENQAEVGGDPF